MGDDAQLHFVFWSDGRALKGFITSVKFSQWTLKSCGSLSPNNSPFHLGSYERKYIFFSRLEKDRGGRKERKKEKKQ